MKGRTSFGDHSQNGAHMREPKSDSSGEEDSEDDDENPQGAQNNLGPEEDVIFYVFEIKHFNLAIMIHH